MYLFRSYSGKYDPNMDKVCKNCKNSYDGYPQGYESPCVFCDENPEKIESNIIRDSLGYLFEKIEELEEKVEKLENKKEKINNGKNKI